MSNNLNHICRAAVIGVGLAVCVSSTAASSSTRRMYAIGNSLTADAVVFGGGMEGFATARGNTYVGGKAIRWGMGLATHWNDYATGTQTTANTTVWPSFFQTAFANETYDAIVLQPFSNALAAELPAARNIIDVARGNPQNRNADLYVYQPWPGLAGGTDALTFDTTWQLPYAGGDVINWPSKDYFRQAFTTLRSDYSANDVYLIPAGEVFEELSRRMARGEIAGLTDGHALYVDGLHASYEVGRYAAATTYYASLFAEDPRGLPIPSEYASKVTPTIARAIQDSVWHVLTSQAIDTGVWAPGDVSGNGVVNFDDLLTIAKNYGRAASSGTNARPSGDITHDGVVNFDDLLQLAAHYGTSNAIPATAEFSDSFVADWSLAQSLVPEPSAIAAIGLVGFARRRR